MQEIFNEDILKIVKTLEDESVDMVCSDVPYRIIAGGVSIVNNGDDCSGILNKRFVSDGTTCSNKWLKKNENDIIAAVKDGKMFQHNDIKFNEWLPDVYRVLKKNTHCYLMVNGRNLKDLQVEAEKVGFVFQNLLVWNKGNKTPNKYYMQQLEFILMLSKRPARNINDMGRGNLISIPNVKNKKHPTEKPVNLMKYLIESSTNKNDVVLDPFCGVGATLLACIQTERNYIGVEIDENYYNIAQERICELKKNKQLKIF